MGYPHIVSLEERIVKAKSSMVASTIPKSLIFHGSMDAFEWHSGMLLEDRTGSGIIGIIVLTWI
jgi:hypothetical protein